MQSVRGRTKQSSQANPKPVAKEDSRSKSGNAKAKANPANPPKNAIAAKKGSKSPIPAAEKRGNSKKAPVGKSKDKMMMSDDDQEAEESKVMPHPTAAAKGGKGKKT